MINIKSFLSIITLSVIYISAYAQRDIKTLEGLTNEEIIQVLGAPASADLGDSFSDVDIYEYPDTRFGILKNSKKIEFFTTKSAKYCILSDIVSGGIRVGDSITKLINIDFTKCAYGRNKKSNALKDSPKLVHDLIGYASNYVIFEDEYHSIYITIKDDKVIAWGFSTKADAPYEPYDGSIHLW
jgi:hypothetical protein